MTQPRRILWRFLAPILLFSLRVAAQGVPSSPVAYNAPLGQKAMINDRYGHLPLSFEPNQGQTDAQVKFLSRTAGETLFLTATEAALVLSSRGEQEGLSRTDPYSLSKWRDSMLRMKLLGASRDAEVAGLKRLPGLSNYFLGSDPSTWRTSIPTYAKVRYAQIYPGVDLVYYGNQRELEYDFVVAPGADPGQIRVAIQGTSKLWIDPEGNVVLRCKAGDIRLQKPRIYQEVGGKQVAVVGGYKLKGHVLRFAVAHFDHHRPLVVDPVLTYSTYLGGSGGVGGDFANAIAVDSSGNAYITGVTTSSTDFPTKNPIQPTNHGRFNVFVTKLNNAGNQLLYSTYLGGSGSGGDLGQGIAVDSAGNAYVTGLTSSTDFPTTSGVFQSTFGAGQYHGFVTRLNPSGTALMYSTYLGGSGNDRGLGIAVDGSDNAYVTGDTTSTNFPVTAGAFKSTCSGGPFHGFVTKINATSTAPLVYSTYLCGTGDDAGTGIAVDSSGNAYVTGGTSSIDFPVTPGAFQTVNKSGGSSDAIITKLNSSGSGLVYSTYLGGTGVDQGAGIAVDGSGNAYVTGYTASANFPVTAGAIQSTYGGGPYDVFVAELNSTGTALVYSTYLGGTGDDEGTGIAVDSFGSAYVTGSTNSTNFPITANALQVANKGGYDAFVSKIGSAGNLLAYSTYLGGSNDDGGNAIGADPSSGNAYVAGFTFSSDFPQLNSPFPSPPAALKNGQDAAFVAEISSPPTGTAPTSTTLVSSPSQSVFGQTVTLSATVSSGSGVPTGILSFLDGGVLLGSASLSGGPASLVVASLAAGSHSLTATYSGDATFAPSVSGPVVVSVNKAATTISVTSSSTTSVFGQAVSFAASLSVVPPGAGSPSGNIMFLDGQNSLGTTVLPSSGISTSSLGVGSHSISAVYQGDSNFLGSTSVALTQTVDWPAPYQGPPSLLSISVGGGPIAMALNPATEKIYVANQNSNSVTVIDANANSVISTIAVGKAPSAVAINAQTNTIYVADRDSADVAVIDGATNIATFVPVPLTGAPDAIAVAPVSGNIYVGTGGNDLGQRGNGILAVIDGATKQVSYPDPTGLFGPIAFAASPLGLRMYVADVRDSDVEVYDAGASFLVNSFTITQPQALAINTPSMYVADGAGNLGIIDETGKTGLVRVAAGNNPYAIALNPRDNTIYVANQAASAGQAATVIQFDGTNNSALNTYTVGDSHVPAHTPAPNKIAVDSAANLIYVGNEASNDVTIIDGAVRTVLTTLPVGGSPSALLVDPMKCNVYVANFSSGAVTVIQPSVNGPAVCLSQASLDFRTAVGVSSAPQTVVLTNIGNSALSITSIAATTGFSETDNCATAPVPPGGHCAIHVTFVSATNGIFSGRITITDNAAGSPQTIALVGDAVLPTSTTVTIIPNPVVYGQAPRLSAQVTASQGMPTGSVTFFLDGQVFLGISKLASDGSASFNTASPFLEPVGSQHTIAAVYNGDINFGASTSPAVQLVVNKDATFVGENLWSFTTPNRLAVNVDAVAPGGGIPTGTVTFQEGQNTFASITLDAKGTGTTPVLLPPGLHHVVAQYQGDANFLGSTSLPTNFTVLAPTVTTITSSSRNIVAGNGVSFTATVTAYPPVPGTGIFGTIVFRDGQTVISNATATVGSSGSVTTPAFATGPGTGFPVGQHSITAEYQDYTGAYLRSKSAPLDQVVTAPSSGGGTPSCACSLTGQYQAPAAPVDPTDNALVSPKGKYTVRPTTNGGVLIQIDVFNPSGADILTVPLVNGTLSWGFSPDDDRLVTHTLSGQPGLQIDAITVYDLATTPQPRKVVNTASPAGAISHTSFSPSGRYLLVNYVYNQSVATTGEVALYQVQGVASQLLLYDATFPFRLGADPDVTSTETLGFSPNNPETSFVYSFVDTNGQVQLNLVGLATSSKAPLATDTLSNQPADFWEFSPCGDIFAVVKQISPLGQTVTVQIDFMSAITGKNLPGNGTQVTTGGSSLTLLCASTQQEYQVGNQTPTVLSPNTGCSNTPSGSNVTVIPQDAVSGLAPVSITFSNVTAPGATSVVASTNLPAIPVNFAVGKDSSGNPVGGFDLTTTATFSPPATVCASYSNTIFHNAPPSLSLLHYENGAWVISKPQTIDTAHQIICANVSSFSPFVTVEQSSSPTTTSISAPSITYGVPASVTVSVNSPSQSVTGSVMLSVDGGAATTIPLSNGSAIFNLGVLNAGPHTLSANFAAQGTLTSSAAAGTLTVTPAPLMVTPNPVPRFYGAANPLSFSVNYSGFVNGDPSSVLIGLLGCTTTAMTNSPVGVYPIMCSGLSSPNYTISFINGALSVVPETTSVAVAFSPLSIMVGQTTTATIILTAPDMVIPIDPSVLAPITLTSPSFPSDILSNNGVCTPVPSAAHGVASCTITVTSVEPNGRTLNASFPGSADLAVSSATADLMVTAALQSQPVCIASDFRNVAVPGGSHLWFNSIFKVRDVTKQLIHVSFFKSSVQFQYTDPAGNPVTVNQSLPDARITIDPNATTASTSFDAINNVWITTIPWDLDDNTFLTGMPWLVPSAGLPADVEPVTVCGTFASDVANVDIGWRWAAAVYSSFSNDNTTLSVKPMDTDHDNQATNHDRAGTPENYKQFVNPGARGKGGKNYTGSYTKSAVIE